MSACSVTGCERPRYGHGWCLRHYKRWQRHGDPEGGRTYKGDASEFLKRAILYEGSDCLTWPFRRDARGYGRVRVDGETHHVGRYVCAAVHGPAPSRKHHAAHSCGNGHLGCCNPHHLRWATPSENSMDKLKHGTHNRGERSPVSKLTGVQVHEIRSLVGSMPQSKIAKMYGIAQITVSNIHTRRRWGWL